MVPVSSVSWMCWLDSAETHETFSSEIRYSAPARPGVTLSVTLGRRWTAVSEHEQGEKAGGC